MDITVKIELSTKDRKLFEDLIAAIREGQEHHKEFMAMAKAHWEMAFPENEDRPECETVPETPKDPTAEPMPDPDDAFAQAAPQTAEPTPEQWRARIREIMQQYVITDKRDAIKELLKKYGVAKASALPDDKLADFAVELTKVCEG